MKTIQHNTSIVLLLVFSATGGTALAQALQGTPASGGVATGAGGKVTYSVGSVFYTTASGTGGTAAAGVQTGRFENVLPVTLVRFSGKCAGSEVRLQWETASETDNDFFAVERSTNARDWTVIARVAGAGTTLSARQYAYADPRPASSAAYYRLKQVDLNGAFKYSPVVPLQNCGIGSQSLTLNPNPAADGSYLAIDQFLNARYELYDLRGNLLSAERLHARITYISLVPYGSSAYVLKVFTAEGLSKTFKLLKTSK